MEAQNFDYLCKFLKDNSGYALTPDKNYLVENRLGPLAKNYEMPDIGALVQRLQRESDAKLKRDVIEAFTTNETLFFRDTRPFDNLRDTLLPALYERNQAKKSLRIYCAACSSGQEPYSLSMLIKEEMSQFSGWNISVTASDLNQRILDKAQAGIYADFEVKRGLPDSYRNKYFTDLGNGTWQISNEIRSKVQFKTHNLMQPFASHEKVDLLLCRNVLIYFDPPTKTKVFDCLADNLEAGGVLMLGSAESVAGYSQRFEMIPGTSGAYRKAN